MHISVWKSLIFLQASRQKNKKKEGRKWLAVFTKTSLFYKKSCKNFPLLQKRFKKVQNVLAVLKPPFDCGFNFLLLEMKKRRVVIKLRA
jgi:hypothetical protein